MDRPLRHIRVLVVSEDDDIETLISNICGNGGRTQCLVEWGTARDRFLLSFVKATNIANPVLVADIKLFVVPWHNVCGNWMNAWNKHHEDSHGTDTKTTDSILLTGDTNKSRVYFLSKYEYYTIIRGVQLFDSATTDVSQFLFEQKSIVEMFKTAFKLPADARVIVGPVCSVDDSPETNRWRKIRDDTLSSLKEQLIDAANFPSEGVITASSAGIFVYIGVLSFWITALTVGAPLAYFAANINNNTFIDPAILLTLATLSTHIIFLFIIERYWPQVIVTRNDYNDFTVDVGGQAVTVNEKNASDRLLIQGLWSRLCGIAFPRRWRPWTAWFSEKRILAKVSDDALFARNGEVRSLVPAAKLTGYVVIVEIFFLLMSIAGLICLAIFRLILKS